ncbi:MarR family winged helix-turn-helix transcriptional regulator [Streptomyces sp. NRRL WC-3549]|uniref:MarR family winged helix-turn-helix transcriptional regulator n=1 Tax=Streptomyces sp. NRRL WC-3549 TaxID=1463925 RepID=UPI0004CB6E69|nr:MarR family transcriptional regulator [Streptomyces sp. NRRL WC-3549]
MPAHSAATPDGAPASGDAPEPGGGPGPGGSPAHGGAGAQGGAADDVDAVTHAVLTASRLLVAVAARSLAEVEDRVTLPQFRLLVVLATHGDVKLVELADRLGVNPSTAMRMVDRLIAAGLAERRVNPGNRRETVLRVTPEGSRLVADVTAGRRREIAAIVARLDPRQRTALVEALTAFTEAGGEVPAPAVYPLGWT